MQVRVDAKEMECWSWVAVCGRHRFLGSGTLSIVGVIVKTTFLEHSQISRHACAEDIAGSSLGKQEVCFHTDMNVHLYADKHQKIKPVQIGLELTRLVSYMHDIKGEGN